ncbi:MAG: hypothetical protein HZB16_16570 [Armatimonadetes bacterium]|nr:hypothetical protein [Armatimonadota bacterium]
MSVREIVEQIGRLATEELALVRVALDAAPVARGDVSSLAARYAEVLARLDDGYCDGDGSPVADTIDDVLYGRAQ